MITRIIGLGSPFGDDDAAWRVVDGLREAPPAGVDLVTLDRPGAALIAWMDAVDELILIDAVIDGGPAGRIMELGQSQLDAMAPAMSSHQLDLPATLQLARRLGTLPANLTLFGISIASTRSRSAPVGDAVSRLQPLLRAKLAGSTNAHPAGIH